MLLSFTDIVSNVQQAMCTLVDILFAYAYDVRTTLGEGSVESPWTIVKLSSSLCWLDPSRDLADVVSTSLHRSLAYPLYRSWNLSVKVLTDVAEILSLGRRAVLSSFLDIRRILQGDECKQYHNTLFIEPFCVWVQSVPDTAFEDLARELRCILPPNKDQIIRWRLKEWEEIARTDGFSPEANSEMPLELH